MRKITCILGCVILCLSVSVPAVHAQDQAPAYSAQYEKCRADSQGVTIPLVECIDVETDRQDKILNDTYREILAKLSGPDNADLKSALQNAERAWIAYRDAECAYQYQTEAGGTLARIVGTGCHLQMTFQRALELRVMLETLKKTR